MTPRSVAAVQSSRAMSAAAAALTCVDDFPFLEPSTPYCPSASDLGAPFKAYGSACAFDYAVSAARELGLLNEDIEARLSCNNPSNSVRLGLRALHYATRDFPADQPTKEREMAFMVFNSPDAIDFLRHRALADNAAGTCGRKVYDPWVSGIDEKSADVECGVSLFRRGMALRDAYTKAAVAAWSRLDESFREHLKLRRFVFCEACGPPQPSKLIEALRYLRPSLLTRDPGKWDVMVEGVSRGDSACALVRPLVSELKQAQRVLELAVKGVLLLHDSGVQDEHLEPLSCAVLALLVLMLHTEPEQLLEHGGSMGSSSWGRTAGKVPNELELAVAALHNSVRDAALANKPYRHISPAQLYDVVCTTPFTDLGADARDSRSADPQGGRGDDDSYRTEVQPYSQQHIRAMLFALAPDRFVKSLADAVMIRAFAAAGPQWNQSREVVEAMHDALAARELVAVRRDGSYTYGLGSISGISGGNDEAEELQNFGSTLGFERRTAAAAGIGGSSFPSRSSAAVAAQGPAFRVPTAAAATDGSLPVQQDARGIYDMLYLASLYGAKMSAEAVVAAEAGRGEADRHQRQHQREPSSVTNASGVAIASVLPVVARALSRLRRLGLLTDEAPVGDGPEAGITLRRLLRCGVEVAAAAARQCEAAGGGGGVLLAEGPRRLHRQRLVGLVDEASLSAGALVQDIERSYEGRRGEVGCRVASIGGGKGGGGSGNHGSSNLRALVEGLRPGLLAAHPATWGELLRRAEVEGEAAEADAEDEAWSQDKIVEPSVVHTGIFGLIALDGQELPLQLLGVSYCVVVGAVFYHDMERCGSGGLEAAESRLPEHCRQANLLFRWMHFVPSVLDTKPEPGWTSGDLPVVAAATTTTPPSYLSHVRSNDELQVALQKRLLSSVASFTILPYNIMVLMVAYMTEWGLEHWRRRQQPIWRPAGGMAALWPRRLTAAAAGSKERLTAAVEEEEQEKGRFELYGPSFGVVCWGMGELAVGGRARRWREGSALSPWGSSDEEIDFAAGGSDERLFDVAGFGDFDDGFDDRFGRSGGGGGGGSDIELEFVELLDSPAEGVIAGAPTVLWKDANGEGLAWASGARQQQQRCLEEPAGAASNGTGVRSNLMFVAEGGVQVTTRLLSGNEVIAREVVPLGDRPYAAGDAGSGTSAAAASGSGNGIWRSGSSSGPLGRPRGGVESDGGRRTGWLGSAAATAASWPEPASATAAIATVSQPGLLFTGCSLVEALPAVFLCDSIAHGRSSGGDVAVEGVEAAALLFLVLIHMKEVLKGKDFLLHFSDARGQGTSGRGSTAGGGSSSRPVVASAASSGGPKGMKGSTGAQAAAATSLPAVLSLSCCVREGHWYRDLRDLGPHQDGREPQHVTISMYSKVAQQLKVVRKALLDEKAGVFMLRTQGMEGLKRAIQLAMQVCTDMRAAHRDLILEPVSVWFPERDQEGGDVPNNSSSSRGDGGSNRDRREEALVALREGMERFLGGMQCLMTSRRYGFDDEAIGRDVEVAEAALGWLWEQLTGGSGRNGGGGGSGAASAMGASGSGSNGGIGGATSACKDMCFCLLLAECVRGRPGELMSHWRGRDMTGLGAKRQLEKTMMMPTV
ncbi:hypothetical protein VOLCADRAFT_98773 [Volvox carteri f. nagariensis]|uniref:Uncharacterized protein n=1 Tax=Volvox carteri f. nagariensis TaxID=3068 RepID=D8UG94_VOLCA|nr:uncharacterized protein VOLCADRAFT_98773 [Volvox carteri f. nagariensis]EFJ41221.1 hypothetical protein VOLCADRAFT_98773 [Volvox carteri f. nagariensis]|eukprot:XP_002957672.1 hypothetical protein VOLCADRAFT_98773 [Volvox carteri f. nagariensis]